MVERAVYGAAAVPGAASPAAGAGAAPAPLRARQAGPVALAGAVPGAGGFDRLLGRHRVKGDDVVATQLGEPVEIVPDDGGDPGVPARGRVVREEDRRGAVAADLDRSPDDRLGRHVERSAHAEGRAAQPDAHAVVRVGERERRREERVHGRGREEALLRAEHDSDRTPGTGERRAGDRPVALGAKLGILDLHPLAGGERTPAEPRGGVRRRAPEPPRRGQPAGDGDIGPAPPHTGPDRQPHPGSQAGDAPAVSVTRAVVPAHVKAAAGDRDRHRTLAALEGQPAGRDLDRRVAGCVPEGGVGDRERGPVHRARGRHAEARETGPAGILNRRVRARLKNLQRGPPPAHHLTRVGSAASAAATAASNARRSMRPKRTPSPTSNRNGRSESARRILVGERPMAHQPVGIASVVTRHCAPAISTVPAGTSRTGAGLRGSRIDSGTPARYAYPGANPYIATRYWPLRWAATTASRVSPQRVATRSRSGASDSS